VVIPISQEIPSDFELIGYDDSIRRIEFVLTQRGKQRNVLLYGDNGLASRPSPRDWCSGRIAAICPCICSSGCFPFELLASPAHG